MKMLMTRKNAKLGKERSETSPVRPMRIAADHQPKISNPYQLVFWLNTMAALSILSLCGPLFAAENSTDGVAYFESKVRPVLVQHCYSCHSLAAGEANGGLRLDSRSAMLLGGKHGKVVNAPSPDRSLLIQAIEYHNAEIQMPPDGKIPELEIAILRKWIEIGAPDPREIRWIFIYDLVSQLHVQR